MSKKSKSHHASSHSQRQRELRKRDRQFGAPTFEINLEGPHGWNMPEGTNPTPFMPSPIEVSTTAQLPLEPTTDGSLAHQPSNPSRQESK